VSSHPTREGDRLCPTLAERHHDEQIHAEAFAVRYLTCFVLALFGLLAAPTLATAQEAGPAPSPAIAQAEKDAKTCQDVQGAPAIAACTRLLKLGAKQVDAYYIHVFRGVAHSNAGDQSRAIDDLTRALALDPRNARKKNHGTLYHRGLAHLKNSDPGAAVQDFRAALALQPDYVDALVGCGDAYAQIGEQQPAIACYSTLIALRPRTAVYYAKRVAAYVQGGEYDKAIADLSEAIRLDPRSAGRRYEERGDLYTRIGDCEHAITDYTEVIRRDPQHPRAHNARGWCHHLTHRHDRAVADADAAIKLDGTKADYYHTRGEAHRALRQYDKAIADFTQALALDPRHFDSTAGRGEAYEASDEHAKAMADYGKALVLATKDNDQKARQAGLERRLQVLRAQHPPLAGRRVALVIGNAAYRTVEPLPNPLKDGRDVAAALRRADGFAEVIEDYDLGLADMRVRLERLEHLAVGADWAVIYYAGHGVEVDGINYLVPVDAKLEQAGDVEKEALALDWVLGRLRAAGKLQLVILDACRNNPFRQSWRGTARASGERGLASPTGARGLARVEISAGANVLVAYAAKDGEAALDGRPGENSPYARAFLKHLGEPGLELGNFFRMVRDEVLAATARRQRPYEYGSIPAEQLFFRYAATR
jgi:tetratricopeptide (TPR) repeat protein